MRHEIHKMKKKELTIEQWKALEDRIKLLLFAGLDYCVNTKRGPEMWFSPNNPYNAEAFGICQCLEVLGYGVFGPDNFKSPNDLDINLKFWFHTLEAQVEVVGKEMGPAEAYQFYKNKYYASQN